MHIHEKFVLSEQLTWTVTPYFDPCMQTFVPALTVAIYNSADY